MNVKLAQNVAQIRKYEAGDTLLHKGASDHRLYILLEGSLGVYESSPASSSCLAILKPGDIFGDAGLFLGKQAEATVAALSDSMMMIFEKKDITSLFAKQPEAAYEMVQMICGRTENLLNALSLKVGLLTTEQRRLMVPEAAYGAPPPPNPPRPKAVHRESPSVHNQTAAQPSFTPAQTSQMPSAAAAPAGGPVSSLFPPGHGHYGVPKKPHDREYLRDKTMKCPLCRQEFKVITPRTSKVITESNDPDLRIRYRVIEPMYYEVSTCPACLYSALTDLFANGFASRATLIRERLAPYKPELYLKSGYELDMDTIFASYYLALQCAQPCFDSHINITAMLWLKLSRLYDDCEDQNMRTYANGEALKAYLQVYDNANVSGEKAQRLYISIGECALASGDIATARRFFYMAKVERGASSALKEHADRRIEDTRSTGAAE